MDINWYFPVFLGGLIGRTPSIIFWIAVIIFASVMPGRGGGRAEKFLIAGAIIKIAGHVTAITLLPINVWLFHEGYELNDINAVSTGYSVLLNIISATGIACLIYAFWVKFREWKVKEPVPLTPETGK